jgi:hypothetical protein
MAKGSKVLIGTQHIQNDPNKGMTLLCNYLKPGDCVSSCDQYYVVDHHGRLYHTAGQEREGNKYYSGTLFVDHGSHKVFL